MAMFLFFAQATASMIDKKENRLHGPMIDLLKLPMFLCCKMFQHVVVIRSKNVDSND